MSGRPVRQPPTRCSYCHGMRVTAIRDRRLGSIGPRSVCADCYQREEGCPWVPSPVVEPLVEAPPVAAVEPVAPVKRKRTRQRRQETQREPSPPIDREMRSARFALLESLACGLASEPEHLPTGHALTAQIGSLRALGWVDGRGQITDAGRAVYRAQVEVRVEWARRRGRPVPLGRPRGTGKTRTVEEGRPRRVGDLRWRLLTAAVTGMRAAWLAACQGRAAATQVARMVSDGLVTRDGTATDAGRALYLAELDRRAARSGNARRAGGER